MGLRFHALLICTASAALWANTVTVTDPFNQPGDSDVIGNKLYFDAQSVQLTTSGSSLTIDIRTNYENANLYSYLETGVRIDPGDLFITVNGSYAYGIPLAYHNGPAGGPWGDRLLGGHVYQITNPGIALMTAGQVLHDPDYFDYDPNAIVWMMDNGGVSDLTVGTPSVTVLPIAGDNGVNGPLYDFRIQTSLPAGLFSMPGVTYGLEYAVDTGANDIVQGTLNFPVQSFQSLQSNPVPEPATAFLMIGAVLIALSRINLRKTNQ